MFRINVVVLSVLCFSVSASGAIIEQGNLNVIDNGANPQNGWGLFDLDLFLNLDAADALTQAQGVNPNARLANPTELDLFLSEFGVSYGSRSLAEGWDVGSLDSFLPTTGSHVDAATLFNATSRFSSGLSVSFWTDPDGNATNTTTRDYIELANGGGPALLQQSGALPTVEFTGWAIVVPASSSVPEPASWMLFTFAIAGGAILHRRRPVGRAEHS